MYAFCIELKTIQRGFSFFNNLYFDVNKQPCYQRQNTGFIENLYFNIKKKNSKLREKVKRDCFYAFSIDSVVFKGKSTQNRKKG